MISAFGINHGISKKDGHVPDALTPVLPGSTVAAYNRSHKNKTQAAARNFGAKSAAGAAGFAVGAIAASKLAHRSAFLTKPTRVLGRTISADRKVGMAQSTLGGAVSGVAGGAAGAHSLRRIKHDPKYGYK